MMFNIGDVIKFDDGDYRGIAIIKSFHPNGFEAQVEWVRTEFPVNNKGGGFYNNIFSFKFLQDTTFWNKL